MPCSRARVEADKADRYFSTLWKHFAHKVNVDATDTHARVHFPMGTCDIGLDGTAMTFLCEARSEEALGQVQMIIDNHVTRFKDLRGSEVHWSADARADHDHG